MSYRFLSAQPVYGNTYWPGSYLMQALNPVYARPYCQIKSTSYLPLPCRDRTTPAKMINGLPLVPPAPKSICLDWVEDDQAFYESAIAEFAIAESRPDNKACSVKKNGVRLSKIAAAPTVEKAKRIKRSQWTPQLVGMQ